MAIVGKVEEFLRQMGYTDEIPTSLSKICNPSTAFIWEQVLSRVRPRQESSYVRNNIIIHQLSVSQQNKFDESVNQIEAYLEKQKLEKHANHLEKEAIDKEEVIDELITQNDSAYIEINNLKFTNKEMKLRIFLLKQKCQTFDYDIVRAKEVLMLLINLTPAEIEKADGNLQEINKTLQKCADLLQTDIQETTISGKRYNGLLLSSFFNTPKCSLSKILHSIMNHSTFSGIACRKTLTVVQHSNNENFKAKRESLGLLPNNCLETTDELDAFLFSSSDLYPSLQALTESMLENTFEHNELIGKLRCHKSMNSVLERLLHSNNRVLIIHYLKQNFEDIIKNIRTAVLGCNQRKRLTGSNNDTFICQLRFIHVKNELKNEKLKITMRKLGEVLKQKKDEVFQFNSRLTNKEQIYKIFELRIQEVYLTAANHFLKRELKFYSFYKKQENVEKNQLVNTRMQIHKLQEEILSEADYIFNFTSCIQKVLQNIKRNRGETSVSVKKIFPYTGNMSWSEIIKRSANYEESHASRQFNYKYNNAFLFSKKQVNSNQLIILPYIEMGLRNMTIDLISVSFATLQVLISNFVRTQFVVNTLKKSQIANLVVFTPSFFLEDTKRSKSSVGSAYCKLDNLLGSSSVKKTSSYPIHLKEIFKLWTEKSFTAYIADKREINSHNYNYYESQIKSTFTK